MMDFREWLELDEMVGIPNDQSVAKAMQGDYSDIMTLWWPRMERVVGSMVNKATNTTGNQYLDKEEILQNVMYKILSKIRES